MQHKATRISLYFVLALVTIMAGCGAGGDYTGVEYMPDMKHSRAFETYTPTSVFADGKTAQLPVEGTIKRGFQPYNYENTNIDYERAGQEVRSPFNSYEHKNSLEEGKKLYNIYCAVCHGKKGAANGTIVENGKYPPPPSYFREDILKLPEGKMFHSVTHGKNLMGGYSSQLNQEERWQVVSYIRDMQAKHIAKQEKISEEAALRRLFVGEGYLTAAEEARIAEAHSNPVVDDEYAGLKSIEELLEEYQASHHGHGGDGHDAHGGVHGQGHGSEHKDIKGDSHDSHGGVHGKDHGHTENHGHTEEHGEGHHDKDEQHKEDHEGDHKEVIKEKVEPVKEPVKAVVEKPAKIVEEVKAVAKEAEVKLSKEYSALTFDSKPKKGLGFLLENVQFSSGNSNLRGNSTDDLNRLTNILTNNSNLRVRVVGHTDSTGDEEKNVELSKERAEEVKNYLVNTSGIEESRVQTRGLGSKKPVAANNTREGRQKNRRTEVIFR